MRENGAYRLADCTAIEPLVNRWAVWSDLISPVPYSLHMVHYQMKVLESYLSDPEMHVEVCGDPNFSGGPFVNVPIERAHEVEQMLQEMKTRQAGNVRLAHAVPEFCNYINEQAKGQSLELFYAQIPDELRGFVELLYDYYSNPVVRYVESLFYESSYYRKDLQSLRIFVQKTDNSRPPFLSTPRLPESTQIEWNLPFADRESDEFFKLESASQPLDRIRDILKLTPDQDHLLLPMLTKDPPAPRPKWDGTQMRVRYFGHACVLVECNGISILTDPWIGVTPKAGGVERFSYQDLPEKIDFAIITHAHHDHFVPETLLRLRHKIECLVVPQTFNLLYADTSLRLMAKKLGFKHVVELGTLESVSFPDGEIVAIPFFGEHADLAHGKAGYVVRVGQQRILFAADSNCLDARMYEHVRNAVGKIDTVFLGMECVGAPLSWMYGTFLPKKVERSHDQSRRTKGCDSAAALNLLERVGSQRVFIYAMGQEPWLQYSMGLGLAADSPQIRESDRVLATARDKGFVEARRPFVKMETIL